VAHSRLSRELTSSLLRDVPAVYNTQINDVLLLALAIALREWTGENRVAIALESIGRDESFGGSSHVDLSRTVGWFTSLYPVLLDLSGTCAADGDLDLGAAIVDVKEQLRRIRFQGIGYGALLCGAIAESAREKLETLGARAEVVFNYLGQIDQALSEESQFSGASESAGPSIYAGNIRSHAIDVNGSVSGGELSFNWQYDPREFSTETIEGLTRTFDAALARIIAHCAEPNIGGRTASDFGLELEQKEFEDVLSMVAFGDNDEKP
jgi:non-ribosomal peptide synthase protein (TIGR01720 family)